MQSGETIRTVIGRIARVIEVRDHILVTDIGYIHINKCSKVAQ